MQAKAKFEAAITAQPFNSQAIIAAKNDIINHEAGVEALKELGAELF